MTEGYSGTPLAKKLGFRPGMRTWWDDTPASVAEEIGETGIRILTAIKRELDPTGILNPGAVIPTAPGAS